LGLTRPSTGTLSGKGHNNKQCLLQCYDYWQSKGYNLKQTLRTTVKGCCVVAWQCSSTYCCPHCWNPLETQVWCNDSPSIEFWSTHFDCQVFDPLKEALRGCQFTPDHAVKEVVHAWMAAQPKTFFYEGIRMLEQQWTKCTEKLGGYIEIKFIPTLWIINS
jgi:hypothetical protein